MLEKVLLFYNHLVIHDLRLSLNQCQWFRTDATTRTQCIQRRSANVHSDLCIYACRPLDITYTETTRFFEAERRTEQTGVNNGERRTEPEVTIRNVLFGLCWRALWPLII